MKTTEFIGAAERQLHELAGRMVAYNAGDPKRIQHLIKVHYFARMIGLAEHVDEATQLILEAAAIVHDIGIRICEQKYGVCDGKHQELGKNERGSQTGRTEAGGGMEPPEA